MFEIPWMNDLFFLLVASVVAVAISFAVPRVWLPVVFGVVTVIIGAYLLPWWTWVLLVPVIIFVAVMYGIWYFQSQQTIGNNEVALRMWWGRLEGLTEAEAEIKLRDDLDKDIKVFKAELEAEVKIELKARLKGKPKTLRKHMIERRVKQRFAAEWKVKFATQWDKLIDTRLRLRNHILQSGHQFVPWFFGIRFNGNTLCELVRVPKTWLRMSVEGKLEHEVWSRDHVQVLVDVASDVRFPYEDFTSLVILIQSKVPTDEAQLDDWSAEEIIAGLRNIMAKYSHKQIIGYSNLTAILNETQAFFTQRSGLFHLSGICGAEPEINQPGEGEVIVRLSKINLQPKVQDAMQAKVTAEYENEATQAIADREARLVAGLLPIAMSQWITVEWEEAKKVPKDKNISREDVVQRLRDNKSYDMMLQRMPDFILANKKALQVRRFEVGDPKGNPLTGDLGTFASAAAIAAAAWSEAKSKDGGKGGDGGKGSSSEKRPEDMTREELEDRARRRRDKDKD